MFGGGGGGGCSGLILGLLPDLRHKKTHMLTYNFLRDTFANTECLTALPFNGLQKVSPF